MKLMKDKTAKKKPAAQKQPCKTSRKTAKQRPYVEPKTAAELGITCATLVDDEKCGKPVIWFDYALGERSHMVSFATNTK